VRKDIEALQPEKGTCSGDCAVTEHC